MFNQKQKKITCIGIIIILFIIRMAASNENNYFFNVKDGKPIQNTSYILSDAYSNSYICINQTNRITWVYQKSVILTGSAVPNTIVLVQLFITAILSIIIDKNKKIKELCTMRFNGTKYKGGYLLPKV